LAVQRRKKTSSVKFFNKEKKNKKYIKDNLIFFRKYILGKPFLGVFKLILKTFILKKFMK
jgi:hypothetical protein